MNIGAVSFIVLFAGNLMGAVVGGVELHGNSTTKADEKLYLAAARSFQGGHWATSARWFDGLINRFPDSSRRAKATLLLGQSLFQQKKYREAYGVLANNQLAAGGLTDEYLYWMAECRLSQGNLDAADQVFGELMRGFPESNRILEATVSSAFVAAQREDWVQVVALLGPAEGVFQIQAGNGFVEGLLQEGGLLLAEALLEQKNSTSARLLLDKLPRALQQRRGWRRDLLSIRVAEAMGQREGSLEGVLKLRASIEEAGKDYWFAKVVQLQSRLLGEQGRWVQAADNYNSLIHSNFDPVVRQRAFFDSARLLFFSGDHLAAIKRLETVLEDLDLKEAFPITHCILGEAKLRSSRYMEDDAVVHFKAALDGSNDEDLQARALWGLGRSYRSLGDMPKSTEYYFRAIEAPASGALRKRILYDDSYMKMFSKRWIEASDGLKKVMALSEAGKPDQLFKLARFMQIKSMVGSTNIVEAKLLLQQIRGTSGEMLNEAILLMAQVHETAGKLDEAEEFLVELTNKVPGENLLAAAELENIRIQIKKRKWTEAIALYSKWLKDYPNHGQAAEVRLDRAWVLSKSGQVQGAEAAYDEIIKRHPNSPAAYLSKMWKADRMFNSKSNRLAAERLFQEIAGSTNTPLQLRHRAQMMSGRAAVARQGYDDARKSFSALLDNPKVTGSVKIEATFALGDLILIDLGAPASDALAKLTQSTNAFYSIIQSEPVSEIAARAWGRIGDSCRLMASEQPGIHVHALQAYRKSLTVSVKVPSNIKNHALMGMAYTLEQFGLKDGVNGESLLEALNHLLAVFYGRHLDSGQKQDPYWRAQSGLAALRLLEKLKQYDQWLKICDELEHSFPGMKPALKQKRKLLEKSMTSKP